MSNSKFTFFYGNSSPFSQWYPCEFEVDGVVFNCTEQYMMYGKAVLFGDEEMAEAILKTAKPGEQKKLGRKVRNFNPEVWKQNARKIVFRGNLAKFSQNADLKAHLLKTEGTEMVEASPRDRIWGIGMGKNNPDRFNKKMWRGTNWLGEVLTKVREEILSTETTS